MPSSPAPKRSGRRQDYQDNNLISTSTRLITQQTDRLRAVKRTASGATIAGVGDIIAAILRYITNVVMTHLVAQSIYGIFIETYTVVLVIGYASKLGLDSAIVRFLSNYRAKGEKARAAGLIRFATTLALVSGLLCAGLFYLSSSILARVVYHRDGYILPFKEAALLIPLIGLQLVLASGLQALRAIKWKVYVDRLIQPAITLLLLLLFYWLGLRLEALILATICGFVASTFTGEWLLRRAARNFIQDAVPRYEQKQWMRFAFPMFFNSMIRNVLNSTDVLFLGAFVATSQVGLYGAADRVSYFVVAPLIALNVIFSPIIAEYHARNEHKPLATMFKVVTKWSLTLSWPVFLCCLVFHNAILGVFGDHYTAGGLVLITLALGNLVDAGVGSVNYLLTMTGRPRIILINTVGTVTVNITLALLLIPRFGVMGAALAAALTVMLLNGVGLMEVYWIMKIHPYRRDMWKPLLAGALTAIFGWMLLPIVHTGSGHLAILGALILVASFVLVYIALLAMLGFSEEDRIVFEMASARLRKKGAI
ncbi:MAG TPA: oligosaccharide flippase family protein [Ktedonosporobacter sp.]|jgi:O-antigen/teichoic acid export membrane protein|nr:oligosaccharide flippase family protein [Ktedonosporobacter sp.]